MKVLILTALYPPLGASGHDDRCRQVVEALSKSGHKLQVLTSDYRLPPMGVLGEKGVYRQLQLHDAKDLENAADEPFREKYEYELAQARVLYKRIERFQPDVVYVWNVSGVSKSLLFTLQEQGTPLVYDLHNDWCKAEVFDRDPWIQWWQGSRALGTKCYQFYLKMIGAARRHLRNLPVGQVNELDLSNGYVASESLREQLKAAGLEQAAALPVLYPALDTNHLTFKFSYEPARKFVWAGRLNAEKAPAVALRAVGVLKDRGVNVSLDFYGKGEPSDRKAMRSLINSSGLSASVRMIGIRPGELVAKYAAYDALLFTSQCNDPFPITPLEAMMSGLPTILSRDGGIKEIAEDGETALLYEAGDAEALADAMQRMMALQDGGAAMAKKCMERLQAQHSLDTVASRIEALLFASVKS
ncbi:MULTISPECIES: glycosyltransferase family 4 protein [unclassified Lentimonas]|uniref:glycosyltransferase family 4 protein n=1 Tax=unclassified Lentimonas TaxID=2630993 RepID=UPI00132A4BFD|nr:MULTISPECIES: glycosyltransferase family 4 protein [unclassified Lentimonas]CAA6697557.1 Unannotated [Lentimonas sp. CC10]CAA6697595.1 Unannotated [Lentimonas sp. CC19]CAA7072425.1 Unannotated [Lentimonas sp. CC11]